MHDIILKIRSLILLLPRRVSVIAERANINIDDANILWVVLKKFILFSSFGIRVDSFHHFRLSARASR